MGCELWAVSYQPSAIGFQRLLHTFIFSIFLPIPPSPFPKERERRYRIKPNYIIYHIIYINKSQLSVSQFIYFLIFILSHSHTYYQAHFYILQTSSASPPYISSASPELRHPSPLWGEGSGERGFHSVRNDFTGFANAALIAWKLMVNKAMNKVILPASKNIHQ